MIDTETTGLVFQARITEISGVRFANGRVLRPGLDAGQSGVPIPPASMAVHGITDAMVADAPGFADVKPAFDAFRGDAVLIGQSVGFDSRSCFAETRRLGQRW